MEREKSWEKITATGKDIAARWQALGNKHGLPLTTAGVPALTSFAIKSPKAQAYRTLISQEMLAKGYLAATAVYTCTAHTPEIVDGYFEALDPIFALIRECEDGRDVMALLKGPVAHAGFTRLN
jgi:glutamate-1-semialdehyde 2,1-aminomutase